MQLRSFQLGTILKIVLAILFVVPTITIASPVEANHKDITVTIKSEQIVKQIPPGVVGWGAMWKRNMLWPAPPKDFNDHTHKKYIFDLAYANKPLIEEADVRNISWPWGVSFSTWAVNWENSIGPWSKRKVDCARILNRTSPWCEKTIVGVGDLMTLAGIWNLEAVTVSVPLAVIDGRKTRWGPGFFNHAFSPSTIDKISNHARSLIDYMKAHPNWKQLDRVYLSAGCEWRHYGLKNPSPAVLTYASLIKSIRDKIPEKKVIIVACASDGTDIPGVKHKQATSWNKYLYAKLKDIDGIALDLHRYRGNEGAKPGSSNATPLTTSNIDILLSTGFRQRDYLTVKPRDWNESGKAMSTVLLENAIHGFNSSHAKHSKKTRPWVVSMAHADLVREALYSNALTFLGWTWFPETLPPEWPHGAMSPDGKLKPHAKAQAFLSRYHKGATLNTRWSSETALRGNATKNKDGIVYLYGGNFSRYKKKLSVIMNNKMPILKSVELMSSSGITKINNTQKKKGEISIPPLTLFRMQLQ